MSTVIKKLFAFTALLNIAGLQAVNDATPTLVLRSQGRHADRQKMVGMTNYIHQTDRDGNYGVFDMSVAYAQSFRGDRLARSLFGSDVNCDCGTSIAVQGSNAVNSGKIEERDPKAWLADYLYLNCDFTGEFTLSPKIQTVMVDLDLYVGLNDIVEGSYFRIYGPITWTKWQTQFSSTSDTDVTTSCQFGGTGYFTSDGSEVFLSKLSDYFIGKAPTQAGGVTFQPLKYAKMGASCDVCDTTQAGFADLRAELGYEWYREEDYHLGINIQAAAPTGNRRRAEWVMSPIVGNGNHWELGGGLDFHYTFCRSETEDKSFGFYFNADITHLFHGNEQRTFDLKGKTNSRYMLASRMTRDVTSTLGILQGEPNNLVAGPFTTSTYQFDYEYAPVANLTTLNVNVDIGVQADIVAMFSYQCGSFNFDLGYNFWGRSCENFGCPTDCNPCSESLCSLNGQNKWALKGDARMFGYTIFMGSVFTDAPLGSSQSNADIHGGTNINATIDDINPGLIVSPRLQNVGVDNPQFAVVTTSTPQNVILYHTPFSQGGADTPGQQLMTSIQTKLLSCDDIDFQGTRGISNTIFGNISHAWDKNDRTAFLGIGASAEFGKAKSCCSDSSSCAEDECSKNCLNSAVSQWTVWLKGGVTF